MLVDICPLDCLALYHEGKSPPVASGRRCLGSGRYGDITTGSTYLHVMQPVLTFLDPFLPEACRVRAADAGESESGPIFGCSGAPCAPCFPLTGLLGFRLSLSPSDAQLESVSLSAFAGGSE